jgi:RNA polymerase sigma factor (sigma-70 family)
MTAVPDWRTVSDADLVHASIAGDRDAFASIYDRYADRLHDFCVGMLRDRDAASDCVQDVFVKAAQTMSGLREPDRLRSWLYAIARNAAINTINARRREQPTEVVPEMPSTAPDLVTLAAHSELAELIAAAAGGLTDRDRTVLDLAYRHGLDNLELADALDVSHDSAKKMVQRLRGTIENSLGAVLVSRRARARAHDCPELASVLQGWDGQFTVLMRKRIARHIDSCAVCDAERKRLVNPAALLGATPLFLPAPGWLRQRTLNAVQLHAAATDTASGAGQSAGSADAADTDAAVAGDPVAAGPHAASLWRRARLPAALLGAAVLIAAALTVAWGQEHRVNIWPADDTRATTSKQPPGPADTSIAPSSTSQPTPTATSAPATLTPATSAAVPATSTLPTVAPGQTTPTTMPALPVPPSPPRVTMTPTAPVFTVPVAPVATPPSPPPTSAAPAPSTGKAPPRRINPTVIIRPSQPIIE